MKIQEIVNKAYWHFFKFMPCEAILKRKWDYYYQARKKYIGHNYDLSAISRNKSLSNPNIVWVYWDKGVDNSPVIVKKCVETIKKYKPEGWDVVCLSEQSIEEYIHLPEFIYDLYRNGKMYRALFSDLVRLSLLYAYGGIWCDSTSFLTCPMPKFVVDSKVFFVSSPYLGSFYSEKFENWFIRAEKGNEVISKILKNLLYYWQQPKRMDYYFIFFVIHTALYDTDESVRNQLDEMYYCSNQEPLLMQCKYGLSHPYSERIWDNIMCSSFIQKLTWKYGEELETADKENLLQHFLKMNV